MASTPSLTRRRLLRSWLGAAAPLAVAGSMAGSMVGSLVGCNTRSNVLRLGHGLDQSHPVHRAMVSMAETVARASGSRLRIEIYPSEQLGSERECLELLQLGSLAMTKVSASVLESFAPSFSVLGLPYLFRDDRHERAVLDGEIGQDLLRSPLSARLRGLTFYDAGKRSFYTRERKVLDPQDLSGLKIRTQESPTAIRMVRTLGGSATPIAWGELYSALQQGIVDGAENNPPSFHLSGHYEVCRHYTLDEHTAVPDVLLISSPVYDALSQEDREIVDVAAQESAVLQRRLWRQATEEALEQVEAAGVEIHRPDKAAFRQAVSPWLEELTTDPVLGPWLERIDSTEPQS